MHMNDVVEVFHAELEEAVLINAWTLDLHPDVLRKALFDGIELGSLDLASWSISRSKCLLCDSPALW